MVLFRIIAVAALLVPNTTCAFQTSSAFGSSYARRSMSLRQSNESREEGSRRNFLTRGTATVVAGILGYGLVTPTPEAGATIYLDPAMYGDQENRVSAVDSCRESVRRAILQNPNLATAFYTLALLDALTFNYKTGDGGPDGRIVRTLVDLKSPSPYLATLQEAANVIVESKKSLKKLTAITIADAVAIGGAESIEAIGGPPLSVQVGRTDAPKEAVFDKNVPLDLFEGNRSSNEIRSYFLRSGLTEREMTAIMSAFLTIEKVEKDKDPSSWKKSGKQPFRERGKMGRMSEFKKLSDEDIANALANEFEDDDEEFMEKEDFYIADSFGTREQAFGKKAGDLDVKTFNKYLKDLGKYVNAKDISNQEFGWIGSLLLDKNSPATQQWVAKYATTNLSFQKDLGIAYNAMTQLGGEYTGGKYENLLKNKPRKTLNDLD